jgi:hypothetical protein
VLEPDCDAMMLQVPVLFRITLAEETPPLAKGATVWLAIEQDPVAAKFTCNPFAVPFVNAVAVIVTGELDIETEPGNESVIVWALFSTAGGEGWLWRTVSSIGTPRRVVVMV